MIGTRGEFKLVPYSGDDEHWPRWVLRFEARSELVGWGRQLDAAAASTLPIVNTTLETEVQTISRQLYAILVVKLEGKALGIVQLADKGEGLEAWRQSTSECEGKSGNSKLRCCEEFSTQGQLGRLTQEMVARWWWKRPSASTGQRHLRWYLDCHGTGALA